MVTASPIGPIYPGYPAAYPAAYPAYASPVVHAAPLLAHPPLIAKHVVAHEPVDPNPHYRLDFHCEKRKQFSSNFRFF